MKKIIIASKNPVKIKATLGGFSRMFPGEQFVIEGIHVPSGVACQPKNNAETFSGALNRVNNATKTGIEADFFVGIEGGIQDNGLDMEAFAWIIIKASDGRLGKSRTSSFFLPEKIIELIRSGKELGEADDIVFNQTNSKQTNGAVGILTSNIVDREKLYTEALILALIPFKNERLYSCQDLPKKRR